MAGFLELIDNTLGTHFNAPVYDPAKGRKKLIKVIDKAAEQHANGQTPPTRSWRTGNNGAVSFEPKIEGKPVLIGGEAVNYVPAERFADFLSGLKAAVEAGDLDDAIRDAIESDGVPATKGTRAVSTGSTPSIVGVRRSVGKSISNGKSLDEIAASLKASGKYSDADIDAVIAEKKAAKA